MAYGLITTYVAGAGAPQWAVAKDNVIALPIPTGVATLSFELDPSHKDGLVTGARDATRKRLEGILASRSP